MSHFVCVCVYGGGGYYCFPHYWWAIKYQFHFIWYFIDLIVYPQPPLFISDFENCKIPRIWPEFKLKESTGFENFILHDQCSRLMLYARLVNVRYLTYTPH